MYLDHPTELADATEGRTIPTIKVLADRRLMDIGDAIEHIPMSRMANSHARVIANALRNSPAEDIVSMSVSAFFDKYFSTKIILTTDEHLKYFSLPAATLLLIRRKLRAISITKEGLQLLQDQVRTAAELYQDEIELSKNQIDDTCESVAADAITSACRLVMAETREEITKRNYAIACQTLDQATGILLERFGIIG